MSDKELFECAERRFRRLASQMLDWYPRLRRFLETGDVFNNALIRLARALQTDDPESPLHSTGGTRPAPLPRPALQRCVPESPLHFCNLVAQKIRFELLDLVRHYYGPLGMGTNQTGGGLPGEDDGRAVAETRGNDGPHTLAEWTEFHERVEQLRPELLEIVYMHWYQGLTLPQIAQLLDLSFDVVRDRWRDAQRAGQLVRRHPLGGVVNDKESNESDPTPRGPSRPADGSRFKEGDVIDERFRLSRLLAQGNHGEVWQCMDQVTGIVYAIKLPGCGPTRPDRVPPLEAEAHCAALVQHRNIPRLHFSGRDGDVPYLVLKLIAGETLTDRLARARTDVPEARRIAQEIAAALIHAHGRGLIHRDLKPDNILIDAAGRIYLTDFGIALTVGDAGRGVAKGTGSLDYMAPEQLEPGEPLDERADIYALGTVLFRMLTGRLPFGSGVSARLIGQPPPRVTEFNPEVPKKLAAVVHKCLAPHPGRFRSATELLIALGGDPFTAHLVPVQEFRAYSLERRLSYLKVLRDDGPIPPAYLEAVVELLGSSPPQDRDRVENALLESGAEALLGLLRWSSLSDHGTFALLRLLHRLAPKSPRFLDAVKQRGLERELRSVLQESKDEQATSDPPVHRGRRAACWVGAVVVVAVALWLAAVGIEVEGARHSLERVRPARAVFGLAATSLAIGCIATRRPVLFAPFFVLVLDCVLDIGLLTGLEAQFFASTDALNRALRLPGTGP